MAQPAGKDALSERRSKGRRLAFVLATGAALLVMAFLGTCVIIGSGVHSVSSLAMREYPGDKVGALMALVESKDRSLRDRNRAIWALGQLGDSRALVVLQKYYTAKESDEAGGLSQYELKKAIALCQGATNIGAYVWRHGSWGAK